MPFRSIACVHGTEPDYCVPRCYCPHPHPTLARLDHGRGRYEQFDDYLEMVIEFGYVTM